MHLKLCYTILFLKKYLLGPDLLLKLESKMDTKVKDSVEMGIYFGWNCIEKDNLLYRKRLWLMKVKLYNLVLFIEEGEYNSIFSSLWLHSFQLDHVYTLCNIYGG